MNKPPFMRKPKHKRLRLTLGLNALTNFCCYVLALMRCSTDMDTSYRFTQALSSGDNPLAYVGLFMVSPFIYDKSIQIADQQKINGHARNVRF